MTSDQAVFGVLTILINITLIVIYVGLITFFIIRVYIVLRVLWDTRQHMKEMQERRKAEGGEEIDIDVGEIAKEFAKAQLDVLVINTNNNIY